MHPEYASDHLPAGAAHGTYGRTAAADFLQTVQAKYCTVPGQAVQAVFLPDGSDGSGQTEDQKKQEYNSKVQKNHTPPIVFAYR